MRSVDEYINWKNGKEQSLEERFAIETKKLEWDETDVLYSFLGVYAIGLKALYPEEFVSTPYQIRKIVNNKSINVYSKKFLFENWENYQDLNNILETTGFLKNYLSIGNLIPIWPGGNIHKGTVSYCFDLPDIYFNRHRKIANALIEIYKSSYLEEVLTSKYTDLTYYLNMDKDEYVVFLKRIVRIIESREKSLLFEL